MPGKRSIATQIGVGLIVFVAGSLITREIARRTGVGRSGGLDG